MASGLVRDLFPMQLQRRSQTEAERMTALLKNMVALDPTAARKTIDAIVTQFTDLFDEVKGARIGRQPARGRPRTRELTLN